MINSEEKYRRIEHNLPASFSRALSLVQVPWPGPSCQQSQRPKTWEEQFSAALFYVMFSTAVLSIRALPASWAQLTPSSACDWPWEILQQPTC